MAEHCCEPTTQPTADEYVCPNCGRLGRGVTLTSVQAHVAISLRALGGGDYCFCVTAHCPVVYFTTSGHCVRHDQLRERVFQKDVGDDVLVCYCFRHTAGDLRHGTPAERTALLADIVAGTQLGQCACELRNPQGRCCLGNVRRLLAIGGSPTTAGGHNEPGT